MPNKIMDARTKLIHKKMAKVEGLLYELNSEIYTASGYLALLRNRMNSLVKSLNTKTASAEYLEEHLKINTFIMKSLSLVGEFNCKFELLSISAESGDNFIPDSEIFSSVFMSQILEKPKDQLKLKPLKNDVEVTKAIPVEEAVDKISFRGVKEASFENCPQLKFFEQPHNEGCTTEVRKTNASISKEVASDHDEEKFTKCLSNQDKDSEKALVIVENNSYFKSDSFRFLTGTKNVQEPFPNVILDCLSKQSQLSLLTTESCGPIVDEKTSPSDIIFLTNSVNSSASDLYAALYNSQDSVSESLSLQSATDSHKSSKSELKKGFECEDIKPLCLFDNIDKEYEVRVEHIVSPSEFYVHLLDNYDLFKELEKKLKLIPPSQSTSLSNSTGKRKTQISREIGKYALVYVKCEETWFRAEIINWLIHLNDDFVSVFLLDYGESKCVSVNDLQPLPLAFKIYPAFAVKCHLHSLCPVDRDSDSEKRTWGKEVVERFCTLIETSNKFKIKIADANGHYVHEGSLPVSLFSIDNEKTCLNDLLVKRYCAVKQPDFEAAENGDNTNSQSEEDALLRWNPMKEDFDSYNNTYDFEINDPAAIIYGYVGKDYERTCKHFARFGICYKGDACLKDHKRLNPTGFTTDQEVIFKDAFNTISVPPLNSLINVQVTCVLACNKFFCFPESKNSSIIEENLPSVLKLMNSVENVKKMKKLLVPPSAGQIVIARFSEDNAWYRARILESQPEEDKYLVAFVDYGNKETLPISDLRAIEPRYLHLPFQAIECTISGIARNPEIPVKDVVDYLRRRMSDSQISIKLISKFPGEHIHLLVNVFDQIGRNIGEEMIAKGFAVLKEEMLIDLDSGSVPG